MCGVCKPCVVFALLPVQCALCCVCTIASTVYRLCKFCVVFALLPLCCVCKSCVVFALLPARCAVCKSYVVFALLPVQFTVCVSPVLYLHYCKHSVLCVAFALLPAQCAVCVSPVLCLLNVLPAQFAVWGYDKSTYCYVILQFSITFTHSH